MVVLSTRSSGGNPFSVSSFQWHWNGSSWQKVYVPVSYEEALSSGTAIGDYPGHHGTRFGHELVYHENFRDTIYNRWLFWLSRTKYFHVRWEPTCEYRSRKCEANLNGWVSDGNSNDAGNGSVGAFSEVFEQDLILEYRYGEWSAARNGITPHRASSAQDCKNAGEMPGGYLFLMSCITHSMKKYICGVVLGECV